MAADHSCPGATTVAAQYHTIRSFSRKPHLAAQSPSIRLAFAHSFVSCASLPYGVFTVVRERAVRDLKKSRGLCERPLVFCIVNSQSDMPSIITHHANVKSGGEGNRAIPGNILARIANFMKKDLALAQMELIADGLEQEGERLLSACVYSLVAAALVGNEQNWLKRQSGVDVGAVGTVVEPCQN